MTYRNAAGDVVRVYAVTGWLLPGDDPKRVAEQTARDHNRNEDARGRPWGHPERIDATHE